MARLRLKLIALVTLLTSCTPQEDTRNRLDRFPTDIPQDDLNLDIFLDYIQLEAIREEIVHFYPNDDLYFLGQSLAWVGEFMRIRSQFRPSGNTIHNVPFSGSFFDDVSSQNSEYHYRLNNERSPSEGDLENYRNLLRELGLDPERIRERFQNTGRRTVILDVVAYGRSLASFMYIMLRWAQLSHTDLSGALCVFAVRMMPSRNPVNSLHVLVPNVIEFNVTPTRIDVLVSRDLSAIVRIAIPEEYTGYVRLVPSYPPSLWGQPPPGLDQEHERRRREIIELFTALMRTYLGVPRSENLGADVLDLSSTSTGVYVACASTQRRFRRDLNKKDSLKSQLYVILTRGSDTFDWNVYEKLKLEYINSARSTSFGKFLEREFKDSNSSASKILREMCDEFDYDVGFAGNIALAWFDEVVKVALN